jgi:hypothetical protein
MDKLMRVEIEKNHISATVQIILSKVLLPLRGMQQFEEWVTKFPAVYLTYTASMLVPAYSLLIGHS